jgi:hypothetical protein
MRFGGDGPHDVGVADVAEYAAQQHQIRRQDAGVQRGVRGIPMDDVQSVEPRSLQLRLQPLDVALVELHESTLDVSHRWMAGERTDQVVTLAGAHADDRERISRAGGQDPADLRLDDCKPPAQRRRRILVRVVPGRPVLRHVASTY